MDDSLPAPDFLRTLYYGDRAVKSVTVDGWRAAVRVTVDVLSRIRSSDGRWNHYADEDIDDADLVFTGVREVVWTPAGPIPNDLLNHIVAVRRPDGTWLFELSISSVNGDSTCEVCLAIVADGIHLEDPTRPGERIRD